MYGEVGGKLKMLEKEFWFVYGDRILSSQFSEVLFHSQCILS